MKSSWSKLFLIEIDYIKSKNNIIDISSIPEKVRHDGLIESILYYWSKIHKITILNKDNVEY